MAKSKSKQPDKGVVCIGFTGTREGLTEQQNKRLRRIFAKLIYKRLNKESGVDLKDIVGVHGDCVGADATFDALCAEHNIERWIYPCTLEDMRAHTEKKGAIEVARPVSPLSRNKKIVGNSSMMIACPKYGAEKLRSGGTWYTIRNAETRRVPLVIVHSDGALYYSAWYMRGF